MDSHFPFEQLDVYQLSVAYATQVYRATTTFPDTEKFGLTNQMRRAAVSISNICTFLTATARPVRRQRAECQSGEYH